MKEATLIAMKNRVNDLTRENQFLIQKVQETELVLSSLIKLVEFLPGYEDAKEKLQKINEELLDESKEKKLEE